MRGISFMFVDSLMRSYLALKHLRRCDFGAVPLMTWPPGSHYYYHFLFTAIALSISPLDWSRFMAAFAILWSLMVSQDLDDPKKTLGVDKVGTEEYESECLINFDSRRIARSMSEKWLMKLMMFFA